MTVNSWFTGIGAADLAFELAGFDITRQCEIDKHCIELLEERWPNVKRDTDISESRGSYADVYVGGWPCQDLSVAGKRAGLAGSRSGLFHELVRVVDEGSPRYLVWENVPGLLSSGGGRDFRIVLRELASIGYFGAWRVLDSQFFGVAQRRRRVFGVFARGSDSWRRTGAILLEPKSGCRDPSQVLKTGEDIAGTLDTRSIETFVAPCLRGNQYDDSDPMHGYKKLVCPPPDPDGMRTAAGVPDWLDRALPLGYDSRRYRQLGNAMTVNVMYWIAKRIANVEKLLTVLSLDREAASW